MIVNGKLRANGARCECENTIHRVIDRSFCVVHRPTYEGQSAAAVEETDVCRVSRHSASTITVSSAASTATMQVNALIEGRHRGALVGGGQWCIMTNRVSARCIWGGRVGGPRDDFGEKFKIWINLFTQSRRAHSVSTRPHANTGRPIGRGDAVADWCQQRGRTNG